MSPALFRYEEDLRTQGFRSTLLHALIDVILRSRIKLHLPSNCPSPDEEVNVFLAGVMLDSMAPSPYYRIQEKRYCASGNLELVDKLERFHHPRDRFWIYLFSANDCLFHSTVFLDRISRRTSPSREKCLGLASAWYDLTHFYAERVPGVGDLAGVLEKISKGIDRYARILTWVGSELGLVVRMTDGEIYHLEREANKKFLND